MSWNGATEVRQWRIYGRSGCGDAWTVLEEVDKTGFETTFEADGYQSFGLVEALDGNGERLRNSTARGVKTFVPAALLAQSCGEYECPEVEEYVIAEETVEVAEMRLGCNAPTTASETGGGDASGSDNASGQSEGDNNGAYRLVPRFGLAEVWVWAVLALTTWCVIV